MKGEIKVRIKVCSVFSYRCFASMNWTMNCLVINQMFSCFHLWKTVKQEGKVGWLKASFWVLLGLILGNLIFRELNFQDLFSRTNWMTLIYSWCLEFLIFFEIWFFNYQRSDPKFPSQSDFQSSF